MKATTAMTVIVFGAGSTGRTALRLIRQDTGCDVVAFADNAARHGDTFEGLPVIAPETIAAHDCDRIVVASHGWPSIVTQLRALGVPEDRIHVHPVDGEAAAAAMGARADAPRAAHARPVSDRIHYACGQRVLEGWLNVDGFDESYPNGCVHLEQSRHIVRMDLTAPHPFPDDSFQWGYAEDFLEHLTQAESIVFLCEVYRTFKRGGVLRLSFPGLAGVLRRHLRSGGFAGAAVCVNEAYTRWLHEHFYTFDSLQLVASHIGFSDVRRCDYGHSRHQVLKQESRPDQADLNLVVELTK